MPTSRKRANIKSKEEATPITKNPLKTRWGRAIIMVLAGSFALSGLVGLIYIFVQIAQQ